jgi:erythronate-4-phosphate dehydrogenase
MTFDITPPSLPEGTVTATAPDDVALQLYDPRRDSSLLKASPETFEQQRGSYPLRRERV